MKKYTIGIDASRAVHNTKTGTEYYSEQMIYQISKIDHHNDYILFSESKPKKGSLIYNLPKNFTWKIIPFGYLWTQIRLSYEMLKYKDKLDILFVPSHTIPLIHPKKTIVTIHDFGFEYFPELYAKKSIGPNNPIIKAIFNIGARIITLGQFGNSEYDYHRWASRFAIKNATHLIAISDFTKNDAIKYCNADSKKISVIYHGFDAYRFSNLKPTTEDIRKLKPYLFFIGRVERKKNIKRLIEAFALLKESKDIPHKLVLAGSPGLGFDEIKSTINSLDPNIKKDIHILGYTEDTKAGSLMQNADVFVFPTLFEGFGIPALEAFSAKTPVVCSDTTALPEIVKDAAELVNPEDTNSIAIGIYNVIKNPTLAKNLVEKGSKRLKDFSWEKAGQQTYQVIKDTLNE